MHRNNTIKKNIFKTLQKIKSSRFTYLEKTGYLKLGTHHTKK